MIPVLIEKGGYPRILKAKEPEYSVILGRLADQGKDLGTAVSGVNLYSGGRDDSGVLIDFRGQPSGGGRGK